MRIRTEQMHELGKIYADRFVDHVTSFVRAELGGASGEVTRDAIAALIDRARAYGFTLESTIVTFVIAAQLLGHDFDARLPDARGILEARSPRSSALLSSRT